MLRLKPQRLGVYQPWVPSMDEGWTRLVLEKFRFPYATLHNADIRAGDLKDRIDALLIPSIAAKTLREGYGPDQSEPAYVGGLGREGLDAIRAFVEAGGTLVCLEDSCSYAIEELGLPVTDVLKGLKSSAFFCPGSILRARFAHKDESGPPQVVRLTLGMPDEGPVYFDQSLAFETGKEPVRVAARYAPPERPRKRLAARPREDPGQGGAGGDPAGRGPCRSSSASPPASRADPRHVPAPVQCPVARGHGARH